MRLFKKKKPIRDVKKLSEAVHEMNLKHYYFGRKQEKMELIDRLDKAKIRILGHRKKCERWTIPKKGEEYKPYEFNPCPLCCFGVISNLIEPTIEKLQKEVDDYWKKKRV